MSELEQEVFEDGFVEGAAAGAGAADAAPSGEVDFEEEVGETAAEGTLPRDDLDPAVSAEPREDFVIGEEDELDEAALDELSGEGSFPARHESSPAFSGADPAELARVAAQAASNKKAEDLVVLDLTGLSDVCDYFVIATGANARLVDSVIDEIKEKVADAFDEKPFSIEGRRGGNWVLMDYGSVVVHVFTPETREYYQLEKLWGDAPKLEVDLY